MSALASFPSHVRASSKTPKRVFVRRDDLYATSEARAKSLHNERRQVAHLDGMVLLKGSPLPHEEAHAVYADGAMLAVPTGKVFVRFAEGEHAVDHAQDLQRAGYEIIEVPVYAPNAAWVRARDRDPASALSHLEDLEKLPGVENVEPEFISECGLRT